ncbi:hypothetical protein COCNU_scaffold001165G000010 [Cocos nucifera]|nr:hypothetical protein [Cocos nucifera]
MTFEEWNHLMKGVWTLKRKDGSSSKPQKKVWTGESSWAASVWSVPALEPVAIVSSPTQSDEAIPLASIWQEKTVEKKKKRAVSKKLGHYFFVHFEAASQNRTEASRALEEARTEANKAWAKVDILKVASKTHSSKVEHLQNKLREKHGKMMKLRAELDLKKKEKRKAQEEVSAAMERAMQNIKSSKDLEDIKIDFAEEAFLEGF